MELNDLRDRVVFLTGQLAEAKKNFEDAAKEIAAEQKKLKEVADAPKEPANKRTDRPTSRSN